MRAIRKYLDTRARFAISARAEHRFALCYFLGDGTVSLDLLVLQMSDKAVQHSNGKGIIRGNSEMHLDV
eukprot:6456293-Pyramimonas_sp.AAC.1